MFCRRRKRSGRKQIASHRKPERCWLRRHSEPERKQIIADVDGPVADAVRRGHRSAGGDAPEPSQLGIARRKCFYSKPPFNQKSRSQTGDFAFSCAPIRWRAFTRAPERGATAPSPSKGRSNSACSTTTSRARWRSTCPSARTSPPSTRRGTAATRTSR